MNSEKPTFETSDLYLTAYLKTQGFKYLVNKNKNKFIFSFDRCEKFDNDLNLYLSEMASINPLLYSNTIKNIKNYIHNNI